MQPISPPFLYATNERELEDVSPKYAEELAELRTRFRALADVDEDADESLILVLRLSVAGPASVRSRRRAVNIDVVPLP